MKKIWLILLMIGQASFAQTSQGTYFTYQGELIKNGTPANGQFDFIVNIFDAQTGGTQQNGQNLPNVTVTNGLFNLQVDLGDTVFAGDERWLELTIADLGGVNAVTLPQRQLVTNAPYAIQSQFVGANGVNTISITDGAVTSIKIANGTITGTDIALETIQSNNIKDGTLTGSDLATSTITAVQLANGAVTSAKIADSTIVTADIDSTSIQERVTGACAAGSSIRVIAQDGTVTCETDDTGSTFAGWSLTGNAGTNPTTNFIGTTDSQPLGFRVSNKQVVQYEYVPAGLYLENLNLNMGLFNTIDTFAGSINSGAHIMGQSNQIKTLSANGKIYNSSIIGGQHNGIQSNTNSSNDSIVLSGAINNIDDSDYSIIAGGTNNQLNNASYSFVAGKANTVTSNNAGILGGMSNQIAAAQSSIVGGNTNKITVNTALGSFIGGGSNNLIDGATSMNNSIIGGNANNIIYGNNNIISGGDTNRIGFGDASVIAGGANNIASASWSSIPGGKSNIAGGQYSFAAGQLAKVRDTLDVGGGDTNGDEGTFIWSQTGVTSTGPNQVLFEALGGFGIGTNAPASPLHVKGQGTTFGTAVSEVVMAVEPKTTTDDVSLAINRLASNKEAALLFTTNKTPDFGIRSVNGQAMDFNSYDGSGTVSFMMRINDKATNRIDFDANLEPQVNDSYSFGSSSFRWSTLFTTNIDTTNAVNVTSDRRLKKDINDMDYGLAEVMSMRPVSYHMKVGDSKPLHLGLIAQEVEKIIPEVVDKKHDAQQTRSMRYSELIPVLIKATQEQQILIEQQNQKITKLESMLEKLLTNKTTIQ